MRWLIKIPQKAEYTLSTTKNTRLFLDLMALLILFLLMKTKNINPEVAMPSNLFQTGFESSNQVRLTAFYRNDRKFPRYSVGFSKDWLTILLTLIPAPGPRNSNVPFLQFCRYS